MATLSKNTPIDTKKNLDGTKKQEKTGPIKKEEAQKSLRPGDNAKTEYIAKVGDTSYRLSAGEILTLPIAPEVRCSTRRFSQARFVVVDPNAVFFANFRKESDVTVSIGFLDGKIVEKFKGKIKNVGRVEPFGTLIIAIDNLAQLGNSMAVGTNDAGVVPPADGRKVDQDRTKRKVGKTLSYAKVEKTKLVKGVKLKDNTVYDPASLLVFSTSIPDKSMVTISIPGGAEFVDAIVSAGGGGSANTLSLSDAAHAKAVVLPNKDKKPFKVEVYTLPDPVVTPGTASTAEQAVLTETKLKYSRQTPYAPKQDGGATLQQSTGQKIVKDAALRGDVIIAQGGTIKEISADQASQTKLSLVLDYKYSRPAFFGEPILTVKTPLVVNSGVGTLTINGWNVNNKEGISATTATSAGTGAVPDLKVFPSPTGPIKPSELIYPGSAYTWQDALYKDGVFRKPESAEVFQGVIKIAQVITAMTEKTVGKGKKWQINSWYRDPTTNARMSKTGRTGPHTTGTAVDFIFKPYDDCIKLFKELEKNHPYGVAHHPSLYEKNGRGFVHIDLVEKPNLKRRWTY
jgi:Peptidase M15